jgi:hypothetical protein
MGGSAAPDMSAPARAGSCAHTQMRSRTHSWQRGQSTQKRTRRARQARAHAAPEQDAVTRAACCSGRHWRVRTQQHACSPHRAPPQTATDAPSEARRDARGGHLARGTHLASPPAQLQRRPWPAGRRRDAGCCRRSRHAQGAQAVRRRRARPAGAARAGRGASRRWQTHRRARWEEAAGVAGAAAEVDDVRRSQHTYTSNQLWHRRRALRVSQRACAATHGV